MIKECLKRKKVHIIFLVLTFIGLGVISKFIEILSTDSRIDIANVLGIIIIILFLILMTVLYEFIQLIDRHSRLNKSYENHLLEEINK